MVVDSEWRTHEHVADERYKSTPTLEPSSDAARVRPPWPLSNKAASTLTVPATQLAQLSCEYYGQKPPSAPRAAND